MKKIYLTITALCLFVATIGQAQPQQFTPQNTIVAFDLDDVLLKVNKKRVVQQVWKNIKFSMLLKNCFNFSLWRKIRKLFKKSVAEEKFILFFEEHGQYEIAKVVEHIANEKDLIDGTVDIIKELEQQGYTLHAASNMGTRHYQKMKNKYPDVFKNFEKSKVVPYEEGYKNGTAVLVKPDLRYFEEYLREHNGDNKNIVFIDDKQKNVAAAELLGITGIKFDNPKQLRTDLQKLGVL